eukprot:232706-Amphidinium_carterae.1
MESGGVSIGSDGGGRNLLANAKLWVSKKSRSSKICEGFLRGGIWSHGVVVFVHSVRSRTFKSTASMMRFPGRSVRRWWRRVWLKSSTPVSRPPLRLSKSVNEACDRVIAAASLHDEF